MWIKKDIISFLRWLRPLLVVLVVDELPELLLHYPVNVFFHMALYDALHSEQSIQVVIGVVHCSHLIIGLGHCCSFSLQSYDGMAIFALSFRKNSLSFGTTHHLKHKKKAQEHTFLGFYTENIQNHGFLCFSRYCVGVRPNIFLKARVKLGVSL